MYMIYAWSKSKSTLVLEFKMKTILLTGGNGFIGRNIRESFLIEKYRILFPPSCELNLSMGHRTKRILRIERKEYQTY